MEYIWKQKTKTSQAEIDRLGKEINVNPILANILINRGVSSFEDAKQYFRPSLSELHDPFLMKDMAEAVDRIQEAIANEEQIMVYGDYDVDGTTAVSLVYGFLTNFYPNVVFYIPDRYKEGYGISEKGVRYAAEEGVKLIIALDCGIKAIEKVALAKQLGVDF
ncbi:MAG: single-stranded-DNA-specific exonuclease, partial [Planctomycetota bacterium]